MRGHQSESESDWTNVIIQQPSATIRAAGPIKAVSVASDADRHIQTTPTSDTRSSGSDPSTLSAGHSPVRSESALTEPGPNCETLCGPMSVSSKRLQLGASTDTRTVRTQCVTAGPLMFTSTVY